MGILSVLSVASRALAGKLDTEADAFERFIQKHQRTYERGSTEYEVRKALFQARLADARRHNRQPGKLWTLDAWNSFGDRSKDELAARLGWHGTAMTKRAAKVSLLERRSGSPMSSRPHLKNTTRDGCQLPQEWSWAHLNATRRLRDQGHCGSCSALATALVLEAHHELYHDRVRTFAPQELISCVPNPEACGGEGGCKGGFMELAMSYALRKGCREDSDYPATSSRSGVTGPCKSRVVDSGYIDTHPGIYRAANGAVGTTFGMVGYERLPMNRAEPLARALVERGPVVVALSASGWFEYGSGIFDRCNKDAVIDHAVALIGFGKTSGHSFWHIQNSWGPSWGEAGRLRLLRRSLRGEEEWCGMDRQPELGAACSKTRDGVWKKKPLSAVEVCGTCGLLYNPVVPHFKGSSAMAIQLSAEQERCMGEERQLVEIAALVK